MLGNTNCSYYLKLVVKGLKTIYIAYSLISSFEMIIFRTKQLFKDALKENSLKKPVGTEHH